MTRTTHLTRARFFAAIPACVSLFLAAVARGEQPEVTVVLPPSPPPAESTVVVVPQTPPPPAATDTVIVVPVIPRPPPPPRAWVHIHSTGEVVDLEGDADGAAGFAAVCRSPCDVEVSLGSRYRVNGFALQPSQPFQLSAKPGEHLVLNVDPVTRSTHTGAGVLKITGSIVAGVGAMILGGVELAANSCDAVSGPNNLESAPAGGCGPSAVVVSIAVGAIAIGALALITGFTIDQPTSVAQSTGATSPTPSPAPPEPPPSVRPDPPGRFSSREGTPESAALARATFVPIFSTSF